MSLSHKIQDKELRETVVADCTQLIDEQVAAKSGLSGIALKTTYKIVKGVGPGYISGALGRLLPDAFAALDPIWEEGVEAGDPVEYLSQNSDRTADMILSVTDARVKGNTGIVGTSYQKLRKSVKSDVEAAVPSLAKIIETRVS